MTIDASVSRDGVRVDIASRSIDTLNVALVGYGEVGRIFAAALASSGVASVKAFDILRSDGAWAAEADARAATDRVVLASSVAGAVANADVVICAVTAAATAAAAAQLGAVCSRDAFVLDVNSASPRTKTECADVIGRAGAHYVEAAVMTSVPPYGIAVPMLLGGPHAAVLQPALAKLGFKAEIGSATYGVVSAIKLCRSVVIKGMEALFIESLLGARRYGVEEQVLASLAETFPGLDWERQASYFWRRVVQHGRRRAEEMREAAVTIGDAGLTPTMASATADLQAFVASLRAAGVFESARADAQWRELADLIERKS